MKLNHMSLGLVMLALSGAVFAASWQYSPLPGQPYGSDTMPRAVGAFGLCVSVALIVQALRAGKALPRFARADWMSDARAVVGVLAVLGTGLAYCLLSGMTGFLPMAFLIVLTLMLLQRAPLLLALLLAAVAALVVQQIFGRFLLVPLPRSGFLEMLW
ncbi:tripartite tricarboxylate transporter TctB family protein [Loktanella salsilacus]|uniref:tripartite tricarboxylate transporter TctB family protein n=1 Tax=Loktanella salsilacus TaxID=195913 RepID=UPI003735A959